MFRTSRASAARWSRDPSPGLNRDLDVYRTLARRQAGDLGVWTAVLNGGTITENDIAHLVVDSQPDH